MIRDEDIEYIDEKDKPEDFPANSREGRIQQIYELLSQVPKHPDYTIKEVLSSICIETDLNEQKTLGIMRFTSYEVSLINSIYVLASTLHAEYVKVYLYREMISLERQFRLGSQWKKQFGLPIDDELDTIGCLVPALKIFYAIYSNYKTQRARRFIDEVINTYNIILQSISDGEVIFERTKDVVSMLIDLSYVDSYKTFPVMRFDRSELKKLFKFLSIILKKSKQNPSQRPLLGVICLMLSNYILKSRNDYNSEYLYKCISDEVLDKALQNYEIWMNETTNLNDKREGRVINDLFCKKDWICLNWAKKAQIKDRSSYVTSFVKGIPSEKVKNRYGVNVN